jgi:catalase
MESPFMVTGVVGRYDLGKKDDPDADFKQPREWRAAAERAAPPPYTPHPRPAAAGALYKTVMTEDERIRLTANIAAHLSQASAEVQARMLAIFYKVDDDYGRRVEALLKSIAAG